MRPSKRIRSAAVFIVSSSLFVSGALPEGAAASDPGPVLRAATSTVDTVAFEWAPSIPGTATLWRDGVLVATLRGPVERYLDHSVQPGTRYAYVVVGASDPTGPNSSAMLTVVTPALPNGPDLRPPSRPGDLVALVAGTGVLLDWQDASDDTALAGYEVRREGVVVGRVDAATLQFRDDSAPPDVTHRYTVNAIDVVGQQSPPSDVVLVVITEPPSTTTGPAATTTDRPSAPAG